MGIPNGLHFETQVNLCLARNPHGAETHATISLWPWNDQQNAPKDHPVKRGAKDTCCNFPVRQLKHKHRWSTIPHPLNFNRAAPSVNSEARTPRTEPQALTHAGSECSHPLTNPKDNQDLPSNLQGEPWEASWGVSALAFLAQLAE